MVERITIKQIVTGIKYHLEQESVFKQVQGHGELTESIPEFPLIQIYFESLSPGGGTRTDRNTFGGGREAARSPIRIKDIKIMIDVFSRQRSNIGDDVAAVQEQVDLIVNILDNIDAKPYFGIPQLESFNYRADRVTFDYADQKYAGVRFTLTVTVM